MDTPMQTGEAAVVAVAVVSHEAARRAAERHRASAILHMRSAARIRATMRQIHRQERDLSRAVEEIRRSERRIREMRAALADLGWEGEARAPGTGPSVDRLPGGR